MSDCCHLLHSTAACAARNLDRRRQRRRLHLLVLLHFFLNLANIARHHRKNSFRVYHNRRFCFCDMSLRDAIKYTSAIGSNDTFLRGAFVMINVADGRHRQDSEARQNLRHLRRLHLPPFLSCFASSSPIACQGQTESSSAWAACGAFSSSLAWQGDDPAFLLTRGSPAAQNSQQKSPGGRDSTQHLFPTDWEQIWETLFDQKTARGVPCTLFSAGPSRWNAPPS